MIIRGVLLKQFIHRIIAPLNFKCLPTNIDGDLFEQVNLGIQSYHHCYCFLIPEISIKLQLVFLHLIFKIMQNSLKIKSHLPLEDKSWAVILCQFFSPFYANYALSTLLLTWLWLTWHWPLFAVFGFIKILCFCVPWVRENWVNYKNAYASSPPAKTCRKLEWS